MNKTYPFSYLAHKCSFTQHMSLQLYNIYWFVYLMWLYICLLYVDHCAFMWVFCATYMFQLCNQLWLFVFSICVTHLMISWLSHMGFMMFTKGPKVLYDHLPKMTIAIIHMQIYVQIYVHNICLYMYCLMFHICFYIICIWNTFVSTCI